MSTMMSHQPNNGAYPTIAIDGRGTSGKTTLANRLGVLRGQIDLNAFHFAPSTSRRAGSTIWAMRSSVR